MNPIHYSPSSIISGAQASAATRFVTCTLRVLAFLILPDFLQNITWRSENHTINATEEMSRHYTNIASSIRASSVSQLLRTDNNRLRRFEGRVTHPTAKKVIGSLKPIKPTVRDLSEKCAICFETYAKKDTCVKLECAHLFHRKCVLMWLKEHNSCPTCRYELETEDAAYNARLLKRRRPNRI